MTLSKKNPGKRMYQALEVHFALYLALNKLHIATFIEKNQIIEKELKEAVIESITEIGDYNMSNKDSVKQTHQKMLNKNKDISFKELMVDFDKKFKNQNRFYKNYMQLFEKLLLFIRAFREKNWELYLYSLHLLCPYFFSFDITIYARMTPTYLSQMHELKEKDKTTWDYFLKV